VITVTREGRGAQPAKLRMRPSMTLIVLIQQRNDGTRVQDDLPFHRPRFFCPAKIGL